MSRLVICILLFGAFDLAESKYSAAQSDVGRVVQHAQSCVVKIYGAGLANRLESYQTGLIVGHEGYVVTSWSTVLDATKIRVITAEGAKTDATMVGMDPQTEIALLKVTEPIRECFELPANVSTGEEIAVGSRVFGVSNLYNIATGDEQASVQKGVVMAIAPLSAKRGRIKTLYQGKVLVLDVMTNNPGAAGGAVIDIRGNLIGMIGKELRDDQTNIWLNYALPIDIVSSSVRRIIEGKTTSESMGAKRKASARPHRLTNLGLTLLPDVLSKTPPYIDRISPKSIADRAGLMPNDLIILVDQERIDSRKSLEDVLATIDRADNFKFLVQRGQELISIEMRP